MSVGVIHVNGELVPADQAHVSAMDRGFTLGDGVFDTMRVIGGRAFRLDAHVARLLRAGATIGIGSPLDPSGVEDAVAAVLEANGLTDAVVRITLSRGVQSERGLLPHADASPSLAIVATPFAGYPPEAYERGYHAVISAIRRNETSPLSRIKSCNYLDSVLARQEASAVGAEEALFLNTIGDLACGASSNLFVVRGGAIATPPLESGALDGITRRVVLELAAELGIPYGESPLRLEDLDSAREAFVTNSVAGVMPVVAVDCRPVGRGTPGPITRRLRSAYEELLRSLA